MLLNLTNLQGLETAFKTNYNQGFNSAETHYPKIATEVPSMTAQNTYAWLGDLPGIREWIGDREVHKLLGHSYSIVNKDWEMTIAVKRNSIEDDQYGTYAPLFTNMGFETSRHPDQMIFELLLAGATTECYDGQNFFDTDHPGFDENGAEATVSNWGGGSGAFWCLLDTTRPLKPLVFQNRKPFEFVSKTALTDENVFKSKEFEYGVDSRSNVGFGFWQQAYGSKQTLDATSFNAAYAALMGVKKRSGKPMGIKPKLLVVGASNRAKALEVVKAERAANGATNINKDAVDVLVCEWLP